MVAGNPNNAIVKLYRNRPVLPMSLLLVTKNSLIMRSILVVAHRLVPRVDSPLVVRVALAGAGSRW